MAHTCSTCGQYCTCGGDWDDADFGETRHCIHCDGEDDYQADNDYDVDDDNWLCRCGNYETSGLHCSVCGSEPPWGCPCSGCSDPPDSDEDYEYLDYKFPE